MIKNNIKNPDVNCDCECVKKREVAAFMKVRERSGITGKLVRFKIGTQEEYDAIANKQDNICYFCYDTGAIYVGNRSFNSVTNIADLESVLCTLIDESTADNNFVPTVKAVVNYVINKLEGLTGGLHYAGILDANYPTKNDNWRNAKLGYYFRVTVAGELNGYNLGVGDSIIINKDVTGYPTHDDMDVIPFTLDEIGDLNDLKTESKTNLVAAINELVDNEIRWNGID